MAKLSIISPVYKAEKIVDLLVSRIQAAVSVITEDYEIILVEDGGPDDSWQRIKEIALVEPRVKGVRLSRNFGQHYAITAGLDKSLGEWVVVMDCDLQDQPEEIPRLYEKALEGFDIVLARRIRRRDSFWKRFFSKVFYRILKYLSGIQHDNSIANFGIYNKKVVKAVCSMRESIRYFPTNVQWVGFQRTAIEVTHAAREIGDTSYNIRKLANLALDIILAFSDKPIRLVVKAGVIISITAILFAGFTLIRYLSGKIVEPGYTSIIFSIWFLSGLIILILGVIGLYIGKTFESVKARPIYIICDEVNGNYQA